MRLSVVGTGSKGNAYLLSHGCDTLLLDAGVSMKSILNATGYNLSIIDGCLISHAHGDHSKSAKAICNNYIDTVMSKDTAAALGFPDLFYPQLVTDIDNMITLGNWNIKAFKLVHDADNVGFYIYHPDTKQKIFYVTDSGYVKSAPQGVNVLIIECNYIERLLDKEDLDERYSRVRAGHMSLERLCSYISKIDTSQLTHVILIHLSDTNSNEKEIVDTISKLTGVSVVAANNSMEIDLDVKEIEE